MQPDERSTERNGNATGTYAAYDYTGSKWAQYLKGRPPYPPSLTDLIYSYRRKHANAQWDRLVDIGGGVGIASVNYAADFKIVHISDPSPTNLESAESFLSHWIKEQNLDLKLEYSQCSGEETYQHVGEGQADMVICATAAHFMDADKLAESIGKLLRPGGTMAVYMYWSPMFPKQSDEFNMAFWRTLSNTLQGAFDPKSKTAHKIMARVMSQVRSGTGGLDYLPIPDKYFEDKQRVRINAARGEMLSGSLAADLPGAGEALPPRIESSDVEISYETGKDPEGEGWGFMTDKAFLYNYLQSVLAGGKKIEDIVKNTPELFADFERLWKEEVPSGSVWVQWPVYIVLGTRK